MLVGLWKVFQRRATLRRKPRKQLLPTGTVQRVVNLALRTAPGKATHWTGRQLAKPSHPRMAEDIFGSHAGVNILFMSARWTLNPASWPSIRLLNGRLNLLVAASHDDE